MAAATENDGAATEHAEEPQLAELLNQEAGQTSMIEIKVVHNQAIEYYFKVDGAQLSSQKIQVVLQSKIPNQYWCGVAKMQKKDKAELRKIEDRWQTGTTWKFKAIKLLSEKPAFLHTSCRIAIDLRKSQAEATLQSTDFPPAPVPTVTIADILQLKQMQRFDLMAIPAEIIDERQSGTGMRIADVRLVDGSKETHTDSTKHAYASLPLTLFFKRAAELEAFKNNIAGTPMLFMALSGSRKQDHVEVTTIKDQSWWQPAAGTKCAAMAESAAMLCGDDAQFADIATSRAFQATEAVDYTEAMATLTACRLVDPTCTTASSILGSATEHLYQLNHVYVVPPSKSDTITTVDGRLFARLEVWDSSQKITVAFRSKAMLQLASIPEGQAKDYQELIANDELRHPLLASLRLHLRTKTKKPEPQSNATESQGSATELSQSQGDDILSTVVVEAVPCTFTDIPNDSVEAIRGLLAGYPQTSERLAAFSLDKLEPSPFYNMLAAGEPIDKALTLLHFTQRGNGKQLAHGFRIDTERVRDATDGLTIKWTEVNQYATVALCTVEKVPDFSTPKDTTAIAVISKVVAPSKSDQHKADLYIESMEMVPKADIPAAVRMMRQLEKSSSTHPGDPNTSSEVAWEQRKCRRLNRYPTLT